MIHTNQNELNYCHSNQLCFWHNVECSKNLFRTLFSASLLAFYNFYLIKMITFIICLYTVFILSLFLFSFFLLFISSCFVCVLPDPINLLQLHVLCIVQSSCTSFVYFLFSFELVLRFAFLTWVNTEQFMGVLNAIFHS